MDIIIVGAGISGLSAALTLASSGANIGLYDRRGPVNHKSTALCLSSKNIDTLHDFGLEEPALIRGSSLHQARVYDGKSGEMRHHWDLPPSAKGHAHTAMLYSDVQRLLYHAIARHKNIRVFHDHHAYDVYKVGSKMAVSFLKYGTKRAHILIAADGYPSSLRKLLSKKAMTHNATFDSDKPLLKRRPLKGSLLWSLLVPFANLEDKFLHPSLGLWKHKNSYLMHYPLEKDRKVHVVAVTHKGRWPWESSLHGAPMTLLKECFADWPAAVQELLQPSPQKQCFQQGFLQHKRLRPRPDIPVIFVGDMGHGTSPFITPGHCSALEDGFALSQLVEDYLSKIQGHRRFFEKGDANIEEDKIVASIQATVPKYNKTQFQKQRQAFHWGRAFQSLLSPPEFLTKTLPWLHAKLCH